LFGLDSPLAAPPAIMSGQRPRTDPTDPLLWRFGCNIPLLGSLVWCSNGKHSLAPHPREASLPPRYFRSPASGLLVHHRSWVPTGKPRAVIYVLHGLFEHIERYTHVGEAWAQAGFAVHGLDHQGHGQSEGDPGYFASFDGMVADALHLMREAAPAPVGVPRFLFGHSMGGLLALHTARAAPPGFFKGLLLCAPALVADPKTDNAFNRFMAGLLGSTLPKLEVAPLAKTHLCSDKAVVAQYERDPLVFHGKLRARVGAEFIKAMPAALALAPALDLPLLIVHGEDDKLCDISGSRQLLAAYTHRDKELKPFPGLQHELHNEKGMPSVFFITAWVEKHI
jgi:acylglycerol lipase